MARTTMRADDAFLFGFGENVHHWFEAGGPVAFGQAGHQKDVEMVCPEFPAKAIEVGTHFGSGARPGFREYGDFAAIDAFESFGDMRVAAVGIGGVEEA